MRNQLYALAVILSTASSTDAQTTDDLAALLAQLPPRIGSFFVSETKDEMTDKVSIAAFNYGNKRSSVSLTVSCDDGQTPNVIFITNSKPEGQAETTVQFRFDGGDVEDYNAFYIYGQVIPFIGEADDLGENFQAEFSSFILGKMQASKSLIFKVDLPTIPPDSEVNTYSLDGVNEVSSKMNCALLEGFGG